MKAYFSTKMGAVLYAEKRLVSSEQDWPLTIVINREKSGVYSVSCATNTGLEDTGESTPNFSEVSSVTLTENTQDG